MVFILPRSAETTESDPKGFRRRLDASILAARECFNSSGRRWTHHDKAATTVEGFVWRESLERKRVSKVNVVGWALSLVGTIVWLYGYFAIGHTAIYDWTARTPWWIADFLPNVEAEVGMMLMFVGSVASYWPEPQRSPR